MAFQVEGTIEIPYEDFVEFVLKHALDGVSGACVVLGPPQVRDELLVVAFAADDVSSPNDWNTPPKFSKPSTPSR